MNLGLLVLATFLAADAKAPIERLEFDPPQVTLDDPRSVQRMLVSATQGDRLVDVTDRAEIVSTDPAIFTLNERFELVPHADGTAEVIAKLGDHEARALVTVTNTANGRPIDFPNEIVPIFTKLTCNSGGCHGKSGGQNGFALSLLGFEPTEDYEYLIKEGFGRRLFPAAPERSLLLQKATGTLPHGGGQLMDVGDDNYQLLVAWMRQGMPYSRPDTPVVTRIDVYPKQRTMGTNATQRLRVTATYSDGRTEDVTRFSQFQSNDESIATSKDTGVVTTSDLAGEAAIMARAMGYVDVFRATVPVAVENAPTTSDFVVRNYIDEHTQEKWRQLGLVPSERCDDETFLRRLSLTVRGKLPAPDEVRQFLADTNPQKRDAWIDRFLDDPAYASLMAMKWGAILQNKRDGNGDYVEGTHAFSLWLKDAFARDMPYDEFARSILTATGTPDLHPPVVWYRSVTTVEDNVDNVSQLFLGTRIQCARCHHHPFEKWSQDDYYGMASFFTRIGRKKFAYYPGSGRDETAVVVNRGGIAKHPKTGEQKKPRGLDGPELDVPAGADPRAELVDWMVEPDNELFAPALVNRMWGHFFGRGIVEPIDDMRVTNPPSNPELMDALAEDFVGHDFSIKHLVRTICQSSTFQLSAEPNETNAKDRQNFARFYPKRLAAEVLLDAVDHATGVPTGFGYPASFGAVDLPDEGINSYFLDVFGRPQRSSSCECERTMDASLGQALHLLNSNELQGKLTNGNGRAATLAKDERPTREKVEELFLTVFARKPSADEAKTAIEYVDGKENKVEAYANLIWAMINSKEFQFEL